MPARRGAKRRATPCPVAEKATLRLRMVSGGVIFNLLFLSLTPPPEEGSEP